MKITERREQYRRMYITFTEKATPEQRARIYARFNIRDWPVICGLVPVEIHRDDLPLFEETARRGFFTINPTEW